MHQLSQMDAQFLLMETDRNLAHVTNISIFDPSSVEGKKNITFDDFQAHISERLASLPILKNKLVNVPLGLDYPYWGEDEEFDLDTHLSQATLDAPGDWKAFRDHMSIFHSQKLDMSKPLWHMHFLSGLDGIEGIPKNCFAVATKIHHAAADGASLMRLFGHLLDVDNKGKRVIPAPKESPENSSVPGLLSMGMQAVKNNVISPVGVVKTPFKAGKALLSGKKDDDTNTQAVLERNVPKTRFNAKLSAVKQFDATTFKLSDVKAMRSLVEGCTINDVVLAICSGALRSYLQLHQELPEESLVAWLPINARQSPDQQDDNMGNNLNAMTVAIATQEKDPIKRLQAISDSTAAKKRARNKKSILQTSDLMQLIPHSAQISVSKLLLMASSSFRSCNLFVSNVPGPPEPVYMLGAKNLCSYGLAPLNDGMGLFIATPSYAGEMNFTVISTKDVMPDIEVFVQMLRDAHDELLGLVKQ